MAGHLSAGERVVFKSRMHWIMFVMPGFCSLLLVVAAVAVLTLGWGTATRNELSVIIAGLALAAIAVGVIASAFITYQTTEYAITSRRVIIKRGFLSRQSNETLLTKVESVSVEQGVLDRIFGSGNLIIFGTGGSRDRLQTIDKPLEFRRRLEEQIAGVSQHHGETEPVAVGTRRSR